jgi:hypothetical protein
MLLDSLGDWVRTYYSAGVTPYMDGEEVTLFGWVQEVRDLGVSASSSCKIEKEQFKLPFPRKK